MGAAWLWLVAAGLLEIAWAVGLKYTEGFTRAGPSALTIVAMGASFWCLARALREIPLGTGYAVWVGIGAVGTAIAAVFLFQEPVNLMRVMGVLLILAGIAALKFA